MGDIQAAVGDPKSEIAIQLQQIAKTLEDGTPDPVWLCERLTECLELADKDIGKRFDTVLFHKFCKVEQTSPQQDENEDDTTHDQRFSMDDAIRVVEDARVLWPRMEGLTAPRVFALKQMIDREIRRRPQQLQNEISLQHVNIILSEGMHRIAHVKKYTPIAEYPDRKKLDLAHKTIATAQRLKEITGHSSVLPSTIEGPDAGIASQLLKTLRNILKSMLHNITRMVREVKDYHGETSLEHLSTTEMWKLYAEQASTEDTRFVFMQIFKREYVKAVDLFAIPTIQPLKHMVDTLDALELDEEKDLEGSSDTNSDTDTGNDEYDEYGMESDEEADNEALSHHSPARE